MKTRLIILTALIALSCAKAPEKEKSFFETLPADGMVFNASNAAGPSKSHLESDNATNGTLYWSKDDVLSVYAYKAADQSFVAGNAYINPSAAGQTSAEFKSTKTSAEWFGGEEKVFFAHYPNNGFPLLVHEDDNKNYLPLPVSNYQTGNYANHQVMFAYAGAKSSGDPVSFQFSPLAPILRFRFKSLDGSSCDIGTITLELGMRLANDTYYYNREPGETLDQSDGKRLSGHIVIDLPATIANNAVTTIQQPYNEGYGGYVILELSRYGKILTVGDDWSDPVFAAVIPTANPEPDMLFAISAIRFDPDNWDEQDAFTKGGTGLNYGEVFSAVKTLTNLPNGFESGKLYDFAITLDHGRMDVGNLSTYELGSYNIINWGVEE